jgi:hypothetical protein
MFKNIERERIIRWTAQYFIAAGLVNICFGTAMIGLGGIGSIVGSFLGDSFLVSDSLIAGIVGIISIVLFPAMIITAVGLFRRAAWSRMPVVVVAALDAAIWLLLGISNFDIFNLIFAGISSFVAYFYFTDPGIRQALSGINTMSAGNPDRL